MSGHNFSVGYGADVAAVRLRGCTTAELQPGDRIILMDRPARTYLPTPDDRTDPRGARVVVIDPDDEDPALIGEESVVIAVAGPAVSVIVVAVMTGVFYAAFTLAWSVMT